jgi:RNA polymerase sigma-70 factor (ECF subfamily)
LVTDELTRRLASDLDGSFEALVAQHQALVFGVCQRAVRDHEEAEEVAQDAFVRAYRALSGYPAERIRELHLRAWLARIALNASRNRLARRSLATGPLDGAGELPAADRDRPDVAAERRESNERWAALLDELPRHYRLAVELRHVHGLSYPELAEALDRPLGTVKVHVHRGVRLLRTAYEAGVLDEDRPARSRPSPSPARRPAEVPA